MNHIEANNKVTMKSLKTNRTPELIGFVVERFEDVLNRCLPYMTEDMKILDVGVKDCLFYDVLKDYDKIPSNIRSSMDLVGVDCCPDVVNMCNEKGYTVYNTDAQNLEVLYGNEFDFIFIVHTLEHVPSPIKVIKECMKILKPNGYIFIEVPIQKNIDEPEKWGHYHPFTTQQQVKDLFADDFEVISEDSQKTKSNNPWYRILFKRV